MRPNREILRLAYRDFAHERRISLCFVLALMAVLAPLLVLAMALVVVMRAMRRPDQAAATAAPLSASEEEELNRVLEAARGEDGKAG